MIGCTGAAPVTALSSTCNLSSRLDTLSKSPAKASFVSVLLATADDAEGIAPDHCSPTPYMLYPKPTPIPAPTLDCLEICVRMEDGRKRSAFYGKGGPEARWWLWLILFLGLQGGKN